MRIFTTTLALAALTTAPAAALSFDQIVIDDSVAIQSDSVLIFFGGALDFSGRVVSTTGLTSTAVPTEIFGGPAELDPITGAPSAPGNGTGDILIVDDGFGGLFGDLIDARYGADVPDFGGVQLLFEALPPPTALSADLGEVFVATIFEIAGAPANITGPGDLPTSGGVIVLINPAVVIPLPAGLPLLLTGLAALGWAAHRHS